MMNDMMICKFVDDTFSCNITEMIQFNLKFNSTPRMRIVSRIPNDKVVFAIFIKDGDKNIDIGEIIVELKHRTISDIRLQDEKHQELNQKLLQRYKGYTVDASTDWF